MFLVAFYRVTFLTTLLLHVFISTHSTKSFLKFSFPFYFLHKYTRPSFPTIFWHIMSSLETKSTESKYAESNHHVSGPSPKMDIDEEVRMFVN